MPTFSLKKSVMLKQPSENSITPMFLVQDLLRLSYGYQRKKLNNKRKQKKTEKFIKFLTKSSRESATWVLVLKCNQDRPTKVVNHSHKELAFQELMVNIHSNSTLKEVAMVWEEEVLQEEVEDKWEEVVCLNLWQWDNISKVNQECHIQVKCPIWDNLSLNNSQVVWLQFLKLCYHPMILTNTTV